MAAAWCNELVQARTQWLQQANDRQRGRQRGMEHAMVQPHAVLGHVQQVARQEGEANAVAGRKNDCIHLRHGSPVSTSRHCAPLRPSLTCTEVPSVNSTPSGKKRRSWGFSCTLPLPTRCSKSCVRARHERGQVPALEHRSARG